MKPFQRICLFEEYEMHLKDCLPIGALRISSCSHKLRELQGAAAN